VRRMPGVEEAQAAIRRPRGARSTRRRGRRMWHCGIRCLDQLHQALLDHAEECASLTIAEVAPPCLDAGRPARRADQDRPLLRDLLRSYSMTEELGEIESRGMRHRRWVEKEGAGVVGAIIAYTYPNQLALAKFAAGARGRMHVILKGAPDTPLVTLAWRVDRQPHRHPARRGQRAQLVGRRCRRSPDHKSRRRRDHVHRIDTRRAANHGRGQRDGQTGLPRTRRQVGRRSCSTMPTSSRQPCSRPFRWSPTAGQGCALTSRLLVPKKHPRRDRRVDRADFAKVLHGDPADRRPIWDR